MSKFLKVTGIIIGIIALLLILAIVLLVTFVSPNRLKPVLIDQVKKNTGRNLVIDGDLSWTFFPYLGVETGHMSLDNPPEFKERIFAEFSSAVVGVRLFPLFKGRIESSGIALHGMRLHLIKNANGQSNWVFQTTAQPAATTQPVSKSRGFGKSSFALAISSVDVSDAAISYDDEQAKKDVLINHFNFHASDISFLKPVPMKTEFDFSSKSSALSGHAKLTSDIAFNMAEQIYSLRSVNFTAQLKQQEKNMDVHVTGNVNVNLAQQTLQWENFKASVNNLHVDGKLNATHLTSAPVATGSVVIDPVDLKELLTSLGQNTEQLQLAKQMTGNLDFSASAQTISANGSIKIDEVQAAKVRLKNVNAHMRFQNGVLTLSPVTASLYQGDLNAQSTVNLNSALPQITLQGKLINVQSEPLLEDLKGENQQFILAGAANVDLQVTTSGKDGKTIVRNLNGTSKLSFNNGTLKGIDIGHMIDSAYALAKHQAASSTDTKATNFGTLTATAQIHNGVISNNDLVMNSPRFDTTGKGTIDLVNEKIDYSLQAKLKAGQNNTIQGMSGMVIPFKITGDLKSPSIQLDTAALFKAAATQQIQNKIEEQIQKKLPGQAGQLLQNLLGH